MSRRARRRFAATLVLATAVAATCEIAHADPPPPAATDAAPPAYTLDVDSDAPDEIAYEALAARVEAELGASVARPRDGHGPATRAAIAVRYRKATRELTIRAAHAGGRVLERTVRATGDAASVQREAVLLAGNLARDEARELLDAIAARAPKPDVAPVPASSPAPVPAPPTPEAPRPDGEVLASASFVFPLATNWSQPDVRSHFDLSALYGRVGTVSGLQLGLGAVRATRGVRGAQVTVVLNLSQGQVDGAQVANINVAESVAGAQIGLVNVARRVKGVQLGLVNVADEVDGAALGIVSVSRSGVHPVVWGGSLNYVNAGIKFASRYVYTVTAVTWGAHETGLKGSGAGPVFALGAHAPLGGPLDLEIEAAYSQVWLEGGPNSANRALHGRALVGWTLAPRFRLFIGGGARFPVTFDEGRAVVRPEGVAGVQL